MQSTDPSPAPPPLQFWQFEFGLEVSTLYHDGRRAVFGSYVTIVRTIALGGAVVTLIFLLGGSAIWPIIVVNGVVAVITLVDLVFGFDAKARLHTDLYRRFKALQADVALHRDQWADHVREWEAEAQKIRADEPPVLFALYTMCWNQVVERRQVGRQHLRRIDWLHYLLRHYVQFRPQDFPLVGPQT